MVRWPLHNMVPMQVAVEGAPGERLLSALQQSCNSRLMQRAEGEHETDIPAPEASDRDAAIDLSALEQVVGPLDPTQCHFMLQPCSPPLAPVPQSCIGTTADGDRQQPSPAVLPEPHSSPLDKPSGGGLVGYRLVTADGRPYEGPHAGIPKHPFGLRWARRHGHVHRRSKRQAQQAEHLMQRIGRSACFQSFGSGQHQADPVLKLRVGQPSFTLNPAPSSLAFHHLQPSVLRQQGAARLAVPAVV